MRKGLPLFRFYSQAPVPPELAFLFETPTAGLFEIMVWDIMEEDEITAEDCEEMGAAGRALLRDLYSVDLQPHDLQWLSVINQLVLEEFRWCTEDDKARIGDEIDYIPHASLMLLGCVAGEAVRLNHREELVWNDGDGDNWPRLAYRGNTMSLPVIDATFQRFEAGLVSDLWEDYEVFYAAGKLSPPVSMAAEINPLRFLPNWDPTPEMSLAEALVAFQSACAEAGIALEPHPVAPEDGLKGFVAAFTCLHEEEVYDLFVCTEPWTQARAQAFLELYGHRSLEDWELGLSPVFVFFSAHPLWPVLDYCFVSGPPTAPLEGLARVETPAPEVPNNDLSMENLGLWVLDALERYTTVGLRLDQPSLVPGLEYFVREELRSDDEEAEERAEPFVPIALLTCVGLAVGSSLRLRDRRAFRWAFPEGAAWPLLQFERDNGEVERLDLVGQAVAIWRGEADEFKLPA
jgi:hypothetical protein